MPRGWWVKSPLPTLVMQLKIRGTKKAGRWSSFETQESHAVGCSALQVSLCPGLLLSMCFTGRGLKLLFAYALLPPSSATDTDAVCSSRCMWVSSCLADLLHTFGDVWFLEPPALKGAEEKEHRSFPGRIFPGKIFPDKPQLSFTGSVWHGYFHGTVAANAGIAAWLPASIRCPSVSNASPAGTRSLHTACSVREQSTMKPVSSTPHVLFTPLLTSAHTCEAAEKVRGTPDFSSEENADGPFGIARQLWAGIAWYLSRTLRGQFS